MKKAILSIFLILICYLGYGQYPLTQNLGSSSTLVNVPANGGLRAGLITLSFTDTTAANLTNIKFYDGALVKTTSPINALWYRVLDSTKWVQLLPLGGGTGGTRSWLDGGNFNVLADGAGNAVFGTLQNNGIKFTSNNTTRLLLNKGGIQASTINTVPLGVDTVTKNITYSSGGGGGGGWLLTGNAGTTAGTNFIGTTDNQPLVIKTNNTFSGIIDPTQSNVSFGGSSLLGNLIGSSNSAFGDLSMVNTNQSGNTAIGSVSLYNNTSGSNNLALGYYAGRYPTNLTERLYINSIDRSDIAGDTTKSIIYGAQTGIASSQRLYLNSKVYMPYIPSGVGTKSVRINPGTGQLTYADTTAAVAALSTQRFALPTGLTVFGNSFEYGYRPDTPDTTYPTRVGTAWGVTPTNYALNSSGIEYSIGQLNTQYSGNTNQASLIGATAWNDVRSMGYYNDSGYRMIAGGYNSLFAAHFLKSSANAGNGTGVTRSGTWTTTVNTGAWGGKASTHGASTTTLNDSITYVNPSADSSILVSLIGLNTGGATFDLYLDNVLIGHYTENAKASAVLSGTGYDNLHSPFVIMFTGLNLQVHKLKLVNTSSSTFYVDYFGQLRAASSSTPAIFLKGIYNNLTANTSTGTGGLLGVSAVTKYNDIIDSVSLKWPQYYPFYILNSQNAIDTLSGVCSDNIHPNNFGDSMQAKQILDAVPLILSATYFTNETSPQQIRNATNARQIAYYDEVLKNSDAGKFIKNTTQLQQANLSLGGTLRYANGSQVAGAALVSDAYGNATWQTGGLTGTVNLTGNQTAAGIKTWSNAQNINAKLTVTDNSSLGGIDIVGSSNPSLTMGSVAGFPGAYYSFATANGAFFTNALTSDIIQQAASTRILAGVGSGTSTTTLTSTGLGVLTTGSPSVPLDVVGAISGSTTINAGTGFRISGAATSRKLLIGNGTNYVQSTETWATPGTSGNVLTSDGTNWTSAAPSSIDAYATTATAAGTTTLTVSSAFQQYFTGVTTQTVTLPVTSTLVLGQQFNIVNNSTGLVTVNSSGANNVIILAGGTQAVVTCILTSGTTAASWNVLYRGSTFATGKKLTVNNTLTFAGTDGQTMTFPAATTTLGGLGTTQTWTGANTFNNASVLAGAATMALFNTTATTITFAGAATTLTVGGTPTTAITHNYSTNATATATTKTVNLGTGGAAGSTSNINIGSANGGTLTVNSPTTALGTGSLTMTGSIGATGARVTKGWFTDGEFTNAPTLGGVVIPSISSTNTLTNKRWTARVGSTTSSATPTINTDNTDIYKLTAQTVDITSFTTNLSGTPVDGDILEIQITGTAARALTFGASFVSSTVTIPTTTVTTATLTVVFQYYTTSSYGNNKWVCVNSY